MWSPVRLYAFAKQMFVSQYLETEIAKTFLWIVSIFRFPFLTHGCWSLRSLAHSNCDNLKKTGAKLFYIWNFLSAAFFGIFICCSLACVSHPQGPFCLSKGRCLQRQTLHSMHTLADDQHFYIPVCISILHAYAAHTTFILCISEHYMFY